MSIVRQYYHLVKPGIVIGNAYHVLAGIFLAHQFDWSWVTALGVLIGSCLLMASACVVNNIIDRREDAKMGRTQNRPLVTGAISSSSAALFAAISLAVGMGILIITTNLMTVVLGIVAYLSYAVVYTYMKRITAYNTIVGTLPGALPGVAGYTAFSGTLDLIAVLIFVVLAIWQLPHFYAIAMRRRHEYSETEFKFITSTLDERKLSLLIIFLIAVYGIALVILTVTAMQFWLVVPIAIAAFWWLAVSIGKPADYQIWAKRVFIGSLVMMMVFSLVTLLNFLIEKFIG